MNDGSNAAANGMQISNFIFLQYDGINCELAVIIGSFSGNQ